MSNLRFIRLSSTFARLLPTFAQEVMIIRTSWDIINIRDTIDVLKIYKEMKISGVKEYYHGFWQLQF